jgi:hypothetical protein
MDIVIWQVRLVSQLVPTPAPQEAVACSMALAWRSLSALSSMKPRTPCWRPQAGWLVAYVAAAPPDDDASVTHCAAGWEQQLFQQGLGAPSAAMGRQRRSVRSAALTTRSMQASPMRHPANQAAERPRRDQPKEPRQAVCDLLHGRW